MIVYLTFNDPPSGIYSSQVIDVVKFLSHKSGEKVKLLAFLSLRNFFENRRKIKEQIQDAVVVPMIPGLKRWRSNKLTLGLILKWYRPSLVIARSVFAARLVQSVSSVKVVYDGRGAIAAEWKEYDVVKEPSILAEAHAMEKESVLKSAFRISVSHQLVNYWRRSFGYEANSHVVIPCTVNRVFEDQQVEESVILAIRKKLGLAESDIVFVYAGSIAGWQSLDLLQKFITTQLERSKNAKVLFLSRATAEIDALANQFPGSIFQKSCQPEQVPQMMLACDYGLLLREQSVTNEVASPVKFAEYLTCGLPVIISDNLGDYSQFVKDHRCGFTSDHASFTKVNIEEKRRIRKIGMDYFTKSAYADQYQQLINVNENNG